MVKGKRTTTYRVFHVLYHARPRLDQIKLGSERDCAGAYICGWIRAQSLTRAKMIARKMLREHWIKLTALDAFEVVDFTDLDEETWMMVREAERSGASFINHLYERDDDSPIH